MELRGNWEGDFGENWAELWDGLYGPNYEGLGYKGLEVTQDKRDEFTSASHVQLKV